MRLLLDTHVLVWALGSPDALSTDARDAIVAADEIWISVVSPWELTIKAALGKIELAAAVEAIHAEMAREFSARTLDVTLAHVLAVGRLPPLHGDPFDRLLIAQAQVEGLAMCTRDRQFSLYGIPVVHA